MELNSKYLIPSWCAFHSEEECRAGYQWDEGETSEKGEINRFQEMRGGKVDM